MKTMPPPLAAALLAIAATLLPAGHAAHAIMPRAVIGAVDPADVLRRHMLASGTLPAASPFPATETPVAVARGLIRDRIDRRLLDGASSIRWQDYRFIAAGGGGRHVGLVTIRYATPSVAAARAASQGERRFFENTKIRTPMVAAARGDTVAIFYTESGGDRALRATLEAAARDFHGS